MRLLVAVFLSLNLLVSPVTAENLDRSLFGYVQDKAFWVNIPSGWHQDQNSASRFGAIFFLIPSDFKFNNAPFVVYATSYKNKTLQEAIQADEATFKNDDPNILITSPRIIKSKLGKEIAIRNFQSKVLRNQPYEEIAYIEEDNIVITIVLSALNSDSFNSALPIFDEMLASYELSNVKVIDETRHNK